ncbi:MAG: BamA/OMP85 family outer membrane protein [Gemmatimonadales bacterium]
MRVIAFVLLTALAVPAAVSAQEQERVVRDLSFVGNQALDDYTLESAIATTASGWWARNPLVRWLGLGEKRYFDELEFRRDVFRLGLLYRQSGYMNAVVDTVVRRTPRDVYIRVLIHEGEPVRVAELEILGVEGILSPAALRRALPLQVGDPFDRFLMQASVDTIRQRLRNSGYPYAAVLRNFDSEAELLRAAVMLEAVPGPRMRVGDVLIHGLEEVDTGTVRRVMAMHRGELFRQEDLYQTQRDLYAMGVFRSATVTLLDSMPPEAPGDTTVRIRIALQEGPQHRVRFGVGYASVECIRVQSGWAAHDFLGGARVLEISGRVSKLGGTASGGNDPFDQLCIPFAEAWERDSLNYTVGLTLRQPAFLSRSHTAALSLFAERRSEFDVYTRQAIGGNVNVTLNARGPVAVILGYGYSVGHTDALPGQFCTTFRVCDSTSQSILRDTAAFGALAVTLLRNRVNNVLDPSEGSITTATLVHASQLVGSDALYEFNRGEFEYARYTPIGRRSVFAWRVRAGAILPGDIRLGGQQVSYVPPDQRFYGGGPNSVRGYGRNELGPLVYIVEDTTNIDLDATARAGGEKVFNEVTSAPTGGNTAIILNAELRFPSPVFAQRMRLGLFVDVGQVWERREELVSLGDFRVTPGLGVRFSTPLGPVRIDAAYNGYPDERGPLLFQDSADQITRIRDVYPPLGARKTFWDRIVWQFAVGQAF